MDAIEIVDAVVESIHSASDAELLESLLKPTSRFRTLIQQGSFIDVCRYWYRAFDAMQSSKDIARFGLIVGIYVDEVCFRLNDSPASIAAKDLLLTCHPAFPMLFSLGGVCTIRHQFNIAFEDGSMFFEDALRDLSRELRSLHSLPCGKEIIPVVYAWIRNPEVAARIFPLEHIDYANFLANTTNSQVYKYVGNEWFSLLAEICHPSLSTNDVHDWYQNVVHPSMSWQWFIDALCAHAHHRYGPGESWQTPNTYMPVIDALELS